MEDDDIDKKEDMKAKDADESAVTDLHHDADEKYDNEDSEEML